MPDPSRSAAPSRAPLRPLAASGGLLGFALGGFFDGILLHQILQWHHLLSGLEGEAFRDLHLQVMADGYFHALMYAIAAAGLWRLWRARAALAQPGAGRRFFGAVLIGFGLWHVVDAVVFHWLVGIHRVRMATDNRLLWDVIWLAAFGLVPLALAWWLRDGGRDAGPRLRATTAASLLFAGAVLAAGAWALRPPPDAAFTTVLFRPGLSPGDGLAAVAATGSAIAWMDASGRLLVIATPPWRERWRLYGQGAVLVSGAGVPAGCFAWRGI